MTTDQDLAKALSTDSLVIRVSLFLRVLAETKSEATVDTYKRALGVFTLWVDEHGGKLELSQENLEMFPVYLRNRRNVKIRTVNTYLTALRTFFAFLTKEGLLDENSVKDLRLQEKGIANSRDILTSDEVNRLLEVSPDNDQILLRDRAILLCQLLEGMSESDIVKANYGDIENTIMGMEIKIRTKDGPISVSLDPRTFEAIQDYIATRTVPIEFQDPLYISHGPNVANERIKTRSVRSRMRIFLDRAKITREDITPKSLSYTAIYLHIHNGTSREDLRRRFPPWPLFYRIRDLKEKGLIDSSY